MTMKEVIALKVLSSCFIITMGVLVLSAIPGFFIGIGVANQPDKDCNNLPRIFFVSKYSCAGTSWLLEIPK